VVWSSGDTDGLLRDGNGRVIVFPQPEVAFAYAGAMGIGVDGDPYVGYDFDALAEWTRKPTVEAIDCPRFLDGWNFLADALQGTDDDRRFRDAERIAAGVYDTLFWGCNLPSVTPAGKTFAPNWSTVAVEQLRAVFEAGIAALRMTLGRNHAV
jgi:hypothetical protein